MMESMIAVFVVLTLSSTLMAGILFRHQRMLTLIATAGVLWQAQWLLLTLVDRVIWSGISETGWLIGALVLLAPWLMKIKTWSWPYQRSGSGRRDLAVLVILIGVLGAAWLVQTTNGYRDNVWVTHGFYNGDTMTMVALVQRSLIEDRLVDQNLWAANSYLEYPTLWHAGLASLLKAVGSDMDWTHYLAPITYGQILLTIPMFFLLMDLWWPEPEQVGIKWLGVSSRGIVLAGQAIIIGYVLAISWDNYIYPQTHFFITGLWLAVLALLVKAGEKKDHQEGWWLGTAGLITLVVLMANAVAGAAVVVVTVVYYVRRCLEQNQTISRRVFFALGVVCWGLLFMLLSAGDVMLGWPHFSYMAAESIMRLAPVVIILGVVVLRRTNDNGWIKVAIIALMAMTVFVFFFSQRDIIVANGERFIYHALMLGFPLLLAPIISVFYWWRRSWYETYDWINRWAKYGASAVIVGIVLLPTLISGARAHDQLMRQDEQRVDLWYQDVVEYIRTSAAADDVVLADPRAPWAIPMFTGRAIVRADYWLAPEDDIKRDVINAYSGDREAQKRALQQADFLLIRQDDIGNWELENYAKVFRSGQMAIYKNSGGGD